MRISKNISIYVLRSTIPYFFYSWLLLSVILFAQQSGRYSDILFNVDLPGTLVWRLTAALIPSVVAFTAPMAILIGVLIGLSKMQSDSEVVSMRAAGVSNFAIMLPIGLLGVAVSALAFWVNIYGVPMAASAVRQVALQAAIKKLESPFEPGKFNSEVPGYTFYMRSGNVETGRWNDIFVFNEDEKNLTVRLITSSTGRVDTSEIATELVLDQAVVTSIPFDMTSNKVVSESLGEIRFSLRTGRTELVERLTNSDRAVEEMGLSELGNIADSGDEKERSEALILRQRRILLSLTPLIFSLLGAAIVLRFNRGSRGFATVTALTVLIGFYLLAFLGEQLARTGAISPLFATALPLGGSLAAAIWLFVTHSGSAIDRLIDQVAGLFARVRPDPRRLSRIDVLTDISTGLRDLDVTLNIGRLFLLALVFLMSIFFIFTGFEIWKFAGTFESGPSMLVKYLIYLTPFAYLQIASSAFMIAVLAVYLIKSRNNEIVTWIAAGQSVYRLLLPAVALSVVIGVINFGIQELVAPHTNSIQDATRTLIRNRGVEKPSYDRRWAARGQLIVGVKDEIVPSVSSESLSASDNVNSEIRNELPRAVFVAEFGNKGTELQTVFLSRSASIARDKLTIADGSMSVDLVDADRRLIEIERREFSVGIEGLRTEKKLTQMTLNELSESIDATENESIAASRRYEYDRRWTTLVLPLVMLLFAAPFAISMTRTGKVAMAGYAVAIWLLFTGFSNLFGQLAVSGTIPTSLGAWFPPILFSLIGVFLLGRVRT